MNNTAEVYMWGTRIGIIHIEEGEKYASFEYDPEFAGSHIEISPIRMPLSRTVYSFPNLAGDAFHGVPGLIADSLPDKFGNAVKRNGGFGVCSDNGAERGGRRSSQNRPDGQICIRYS